jgi:hypothetical protein
MATFLRTGITKNIGTTTTTVLSPTGNSNFTVIGCNLANITDAEVTVSIYVTDTGNNDATLIKNLPIVPYTSTKVITNGEKLIIASGCKLKIISDTANSVDAVISYAEIA